MIYQQLMSASIIFMSFFLQSILTISDQELYINIEQETNETIFLNYNLTTNYSYYLTFRLFGHEQTKYGPYLPVNRSIEHTIPIQSRSNILNDITPLFIICFHFFISLNNLHIQCKDIRSVKQQFDDESTDFLPSYNPLFVPMMYALSVLMLLPVIIQNHRHRQLQSVRRRKQIRQLSVSIAQDKQNPKRNFAQRMLLYFRENENLNYSSMPSNIELQSMPSTKTLHDVIDDNPNPTNVTFTLEHSPSFQHQYDDLDLNQQSNMDAHDCIAHLLDNTPWNGTHSDQPLHRSHSIRSVIRDCAVAIKEQHLPTTIITFHDDQQKPNSTVYFDLHQVNRAFVESDV